jgi:hypothetical protein
MLIAKNQYHYNIAVMSIYGISIFPLFAWALGLFSVYMIYLYLEMVLKIHETIKKVILFIILYWSILISTETIAYHIFNIKNMATKMYAGLPICNCIHAPKWMQISYLLLGIIYFTISKLMKLNNPLIIKETIKDDKS